MQQKSRLFNRKTILAISPAVVLLLVELFQWDIIDWVTPFLLSPLRFSLWLLVGVAVIRSLVAAYRSRREGPSVLLVPIFLVAAVLAAWFTPFTDLWLRANFELKKTARERVVIQVVRGELVANVSHNSSLIALSGGAGVSKGGDEILVQGPPREAYVFFYTYRGILGSYSGFLWVPTGGKPELFSDVGETGTQIESFGGNWYFVGHR